MDIERLVLVFLIKKYCIIFIKNNGGCSRVYEESSAWGVGWRGGGGVVVGI